MMWNCNHFINWDLYDNTGVLSSKYGTCMIETPCRIQRRYTTSNEMQTWKLELGFSNRIIWYLVVLGVWVFEVHNDDVCLNSLVHLWFFRCHLSVVRYCINHIFKSYFFLSNSSLAPFSWLIVVDTHRAWYLGAVVVCWTDISSHE